MKRQLLTRLSVWGLYELCLQGPGGGNPFVDVRLSAQFKHKKRVVEVDGFYNEEGIYRVRFMPDNVGRWSYLTKSNRHELDGRAGGFNCTEPSPP